MRMSRAASRFSGVGRSLSGAARDFAGLGGCGLIVYGAWLVYEPSAYIIAGGILVAIAVIMARDPGTE
jgi:hypothetical protein